MNTEIYELLELNRLLDYCAEEAASSMGRDRILNSTPLENAAVIRQELGLVDEMTALLNRGSFPIHGLTDVSSTLARIAPPGGMPDRDEYTPLADFLIVSGRVKKHIESQESRLPGLSGLALQLGEFNEITERMSHIFDQTGEILDNASPELKQIRRQIESERRRLSASIEKAMRSWQRQNYTQEDAPAFREGKLLIPVKSEHRGRVEGVVYDESTSGATVFVEPLESISIGNAIKKLEGDERREIHRILTALCDQIRQRFREITLSLEILAQFDHIYARGRFARRLKCIQPKISDRPMIILNEARHPLLALKEGIEVIPISLTLGGPEGNILVITGPNAGGKTVALKTVGLLCLMASCGLLVPAKKGTTLPCLDNIHCDIGDRQSLEQDLSTYQSHLLRLKAALEDESEAKLVLLDEFGSGTDPAEGSAIARSSLLEFRQQGALVIATTHHGTLKVFAHETGGIFNGSMEFNAETLQPTFRFRAGIPGSSYALEISSRIGLDQAIVDAAREFIGEATTRLEDLLNRLNDSLRISEEARRSAELKATELEALKQLYDERLKGIRKTEKEKLQEAAKEAKEILRDANKRIEAAIREIKESQANKSVVKSARDRVQSEKQRVEKLLSSTKKKQKEESRWTGNVGDWVYTDNLNEPVQVLALRKDGKEAQLEVGVIHLWMDTAKLHFANPPDQDKNRKNIQVSVTRSTDSNAYELDLRGMLADEAQFALEKYLSDCLMSDWKSVRIIHGKGTGALRTRVQEVLKRHPDVKSFRFGHPEEGEYGVTVVELK